MRLDKYLKVSRIIKRRTIAKDLADDERVYINGKLAKPAADVMVGDEIQIHFEHRHITIQVTFISEKMHKDNPPMYDLVEDKRIEKPKN